MTDSFDQLFSELDNDIPDDGFTDAVVARINRPQRARQVVYSVIGILVAVLVAGPLTDIAMIMANYALGMTGGSVAWLLPNPGVLIATLVLVSVPLAWQLVEDLV